jgi:hypothetical protein
MHENGKRPFPQTLPSSRGREGGISVRFPLRGGSVPLSLDLAVVSKTPS